MSTKDFQKMAALSHKILSSATGKITHVQILTQSFQALTIQVREWRSRPGAIPGIPKERFPNHFLKREKVQHEEYLTQENKDFIKEIIEDKYGPPAIIKGVSTYQSPLKIEPIPRGEWNPQCRRTGVIAKKIGEYPLWLKNGKIIATTLLQVLDNHVVKYFPPGEYKQGRPLAKSLVNPMKFGCLLVGSGSTDPQEFTKEYCGLFANSGVMPKKRLARFFISPEAAIQPGTPLYATHYRVGDVVDVRAKTMDRGFQGVMKRWGFHGMPASHGQTKTHRRPGNIGSGGTKARVMPGTKMPGHMGNRYRMARGLRIWRINTKYNVLYVSGSGIPGETNSMVYIYDTFLPKRRFKEAPPFPTFYPEDLKEDLPEDIYYEEVHPFSSPSLNFKEEDK